MSALALKLAPGVSLDRLPQWADEWERLLDRSARAAEVRKTVLPELAAVSVSTGFFRDRPQPSISDDGSVYVWLDGEIWSGPESATCGSMGVWEYGSGSDSHTPIPPHPHT